MDQFPETEFELFQYLYFRLTFLDVGWVFFALKCKFLLLFSEDFT